MTNLLPLYLILPICLVWIAIVFLDDRRQRAARLAFVSATMSARILPELSRGRWWCKLILQLTAIVLGLVALAGPRYGSEFEQVVPRGSDLYVAIDVSKSMLADDVQPSRLGRAKADVASLLNRLDGERVGLIAFAGQAVVKCPLTVDYDSFRRALEELDPDSAPRGGTAIGDAIRKALEVFHDASHRDQSILLITDGDDQQSYPLEAADVAAERKVTVFTVGLGDADQGSRIPQKNDSTKDPVGTFVEYQGEQVWSKLNGSLLQEIALKTSGVYIPAGTRAYDLGELYSDHLRGRLGSSEESQQRIRQKEQFQLFLSLSLIALLLDFSMSMYRRVVVNPNATSDTASSNSLEQADRTKLNRSTSVVSTPSMSSTSAGAMAFVGFVVGLAHQAVAVEPGTTIKEGISAYSAEKFEEARNKFRSATEELEKSKSSESAVGSFDEACALHRNGEWDLAREAYLKAGLSRDRKLSTAAHFNLGTMLVERARSLAGDAPASVPSEKRQEILDFLTGSVTSFRHCLELQPDHQPSRRNIELVRSWIKYYSDQWREADRRKRRNETNVAQFLEYLMQTQLVLKGTVEQFTPTTRLDQYAEVKQVQQELAEEIPVLREKIGEELMPGSDRSSQGQSSADQISPEQKKQLEEAISLLQNWTDDAGKEMEKASVSLAAKLQKKATTEQQAAFDSLDKIWDAIVSFPPLLKKEHGDQHVIVQMLDPDRGKSTKEDKVDDDNNEESNQGNDSESDKEEVNETVELGGHQIEQLTKVQERVLKKARLLKPKAESELAQFEASEKSNRQVESTANDQPNNELPKPEKLLNDQEPNTSGNSNAETPNQEQIDPEQVKEGYRKAIELAPQAVEQMEQAYKFLEQNDAKQAATPAREAYRILDEIQKAQPKQKPQNDQNKSDEQQKSDDENDEDQKDEKGESNSDNRQKDSNQEPRERQPQEEMADRPPSHIEDVLRKLRERQQKKRENDRKMKVKGFGRAPVDKDW